MKRSLKRTLGLALTAALALSLFTGCSTPGSKAPDNPNNQRISVKGVSFDDLTLADWEAAKLGQIEAPFTAESFEVLDS